MDWRHLVYTILRGVLKFVADEYYPVGSFGRRGGHANKGKASKGKGKGGFWEDRGYEWYAGI